MPAVNALWDTSYGVAILVKIGLLAAAVVLASGNLLRTRPRLAAAPRDPAGAAGAARLLRRLVGGEACSSPAPCSPPPCSPAWPRRRRPSRSRTRRWPMSAPAGWRPRSAGPATASRCSSRPTRPRRPTASPCASPAAARPVRGATVTLAFNHLQMEMPQQHYALREVAPGVYRRSAPALIMVGPWSLAFSIAPPGQPPSPR